MRLLAYDIDESIISYLQLSNLYLCDIAEDFNDALYHSEVRFYNIIIVHDSVGNLQKLLNNVDAKECAVIVIMNEYKKENEIALLNKGAISVLYQPFDLEYILTKIETIHRENFFKDIVFKNDFILNFEERSIRDNNNNQCVIKGKKSFEIFTYLVKKRDRAPISKEELINVVYEEPEMVNPNIIELNINNIRNSLKKTFNQDLIATVRNRGYRIKI